MAIPSRPIITAGNSEIRGERSSRPWDMGMPGLKETFFRPFWHQFDLKIMGGGGGGGGGKEVSPVLSPISSA